MSFKDAKKRKEYHKEYHKLYHQRKKSDPKYIARRLKNQISFWKKHPLVKKAINIANAGVRYKKIKKKYQCEECHKKGYVEKHHEDYTKPLEIIWLCRSCHSLKRVREFRKK